MVWNHIYGTRCLLLVVVVSLSNREEQQASTHTNAWGPTSELKSSVLLHPRIAVHCAARSAIVSFLLANYLGLPLRLIERERTCEFVRMGVGLTTYTMSPSRLTVCSWLSSKVEVDSRPSIKVEDDSRLSSKVEVESSRESRFEVESTFESTSYPLRSFLPITTASCTADHIHPVTSVRSVQISPSNPIEIKGRARTFHQGPCARYSRPLLA